MNIREEVINKLKEKIRNGQIWLRSKDIFELGLNYVGIKYWADKGYVRVKPKSLMTKEFNAEDVLKIIEAGSFVKFKKSQKSQNEK